MMTTTTPVQRRPRPSAAELITELRAVAGDLPRFATAPLYRRWHRRWGATEDEVRAAMPGDELIDDVAYLATRAITIDAPPEAVWPWLVQVGCLKAGFYADDLLDNLGHPSAATLLPDFQHLQNGQWVPMSPTPTDTTAFKVAGFEPHRWLLWQQPLSTWSWTLAGLPGGRTRLVTRLRIHLDWSHPAMSLFSVVLNEFGDFPMMRRMLLGIRHRAEATHRATASDSGYRREMHAKTSTDDSVRVLIHALDQAGDVLDHVHPDDLLRPTPCDEWNVAALADHLVATPSRFLAMMKGEEPDWSAAPPHVEHGWGPEFRNHADDLVHAWHQLEGDPPTPAQWQVAELAVHTWDLATAIGLTVEGLEPEVAETALDFMQASLRPELRGQAFGPEQSVPPDAGPYARLAAFAGRATG